MPTESAPPEFLAIGHATRDLLPGGGWRLGGTVVFASLTAARLGLRAGIVTAGPPDVLRALWKLAPEIAVAALPSADATTFKNVYEASGRRRQYLHGRAAPLTVDAVPEAWRACPLVLLAPLAQEVASDLAGAFPHALVAATPQGWLRRWDATGLVRPDDWHNAAQVVPHLTALVLSQEDVAPPVDLALGAAPPPRNDDTIDEWIARWARSVPHVVITKGAAGADLMLGERREHFAAYPAREVDPTGAGDVFAAAFLVQLAATGDPRDAADFANCAASFAVEGDGVGGIPLLAQVRARLRTSKRVPLE